MKTGQRRKKARACQQLTYSFCPVWCWNVYRVSLTFIQPTLYPLLLVTEQERTASLPSFTVTFCTEPINRGSKYSPRLPEQNMWLFQCYINERNHSLIQFKQRRLRRNFDLLYRKFLSHIKKNLIKSTWSRNMSIGFSWFNTNWNYSVEFTCQWKLKNN